MKITDGNPVDAQHAAYLPDCDVFLSADKNFVKVAGRIAAAAPAPVGQVRQVVWTPADDIVDAIEAALPA